MIGALVLLLLAGIAPPGAAPRKAAADVPLDACRLLTPGEIAAVAGGRVAETKPTSRSAGGLTISDCFYRAEPFDGSVSLEVARSGRGGNGSARPVRDRWNAMFHAEKDEERAAGSGATGTPASAAKENPKGREKDSPPRRVDLGDEAFWLANPASGVLYVLKGDAWLRISVGGAAEESVKQGQAAELARKALGRL
jgi:hypothetical protein